MTTKGTKDFISFIKFSKSSKKYVAINDLLFWSFEALRCKVNLCYFCGQN